MADFDVLVVGGGPVGSRTAYGLAKSDYKVMVVEKGERVSGKASCTGIISRECVKLFDVDEFCILWEVRSAKLFAPSGEFIRVSKEDVQAYVIDRALFDLALAERARSRGAEYVLNSRVTDISTSGDGIMLHLEGGRTLKGRAAVIANGFGSVLPARWGLGSVEEYVLGAQTEVWTQDVGEIEIYFSHNIAPDFFAWLVPVSWDKARVGILSRKEPGKCLKAFLVKLSSQGKIKDSEGMVMYGGIPLKPLIRTYGDRVLVVGDAAGQVKPTTGGGIYFGLLCADIISEVLGKALAAGDLSARMLSQYERLWKQKLSRELRMEHLLRKLYNKLSNRQIEAIFRVAKEKKIYESLVDSPCLSFDWHGELLLDVLRRAGFWNDLVKYIPAGIRAPLREVVKWARQPVGSAGSHGGDPSRAGGGSDCSVKEPEGSGMFTPSL